LGLEVELIACLLGRRGLLGDRLGRRGWRLGDRFRLRPGDGKRSVLFVDQGWLLDRLLVASAVEADR
jgi:hypothetical protein